MAKKKVAPAKKPAAKKETKEKKPAADKPVNMGLGRLKGVYQERRARLDAEIDRQSGAKKSK